MVKYGGVRWSTVEYVGVLIVELHMVTNGGIRQHTKAYGGVRLRTVAYG